MISPTRLVARRARPQTPLLALALLLSTSPPATALAPLCNQLITHSMTLTGDAACSSGGFVVGADGITIDLGGFTLSGDGGAGDIGIDVNGHDKVTIKHGTVRGFDVGIEADAAIGVVSEKLKLSGVTVRDSTTKGASLIGEALTIDKCAFLKNGDVGVELAAQFGTVASSAFVDNGSDGLRIRSAFGLKITKVTATVNAGSGLVADMGDELTIASSTFARNDQNGVALSSFSGTKLMRNTIVGNGDLGVYAKNSADSPEGRNVIAGNLVGGNGESGILLFDASSGTAITKNRLIANNGAGVAVDVDPQATLVQGNTAIGNAGAGFEIRNATTTVTKNVSNANLQGFLAPAGAVDGGGNTARANAGPIPCLPAIACAPAFVPKSGSTTPTCGMHVTTSIALGADSPVCIGTSGLVVDADGITIDLNGHMLRGDRSDGPVGIDLGTHQNVTIENGVVTGFGIGVRALTFGGAVKLANVEVRNSLHDGAVLVGAGAAAISKSVFVGNTGSGILIGQPTIPRVRASFFVANGVDGIESLAQGGAFATATVALNQGPGVAMASGGGGSVFQRGLVAGNVQDGVVIDGPIAPTIAKSTLIGNQHDGIHSTSVAGPLVFDANYVAGNGSHGIEIAGASQPNVVTKNTLIGNGANGVSATFVVPSITVVKNVAIGNFFAGFSAVGPGTFTKNVANANLVEGIAASAATDGGGNKARDNALPEQCSPAIACQ